LLILLFGVLFKVEQLPGASFLLMIGLLLCSVFCIYKIFKG
jgi:hypothetical protein